ncbi:hypothetical protein Dda_1741 [Drechslerella dactyloides]|uniref:Uncharacterized protein n=1 Tax=Drechslerella dactyloides TaxID=74499 RepID=A0AAD6J2L0_DREDA|nr:hypothetical protein Dda_1741 [Drechslerella dactyloides]
MAITVPFDTHFDSARPTDPHDSLSPAHSFETFARLLIGFRTNLPARRIRENPQTARLNAGCVDRRAGGQPGGLPIAIVGIPAAARADMPTCTAANHRPVESSMPSRSIL